MSATVDFFPNMDSVFNQTRRMSIPYMPTSRHQISNINMPTRRFSVQTDGSHFMSSVSTQQNHPVYQIPPQAHQQQQRFHCVQKPPLRNVLSAPLAQLAPPTPAAIQRKDSLKSSNDNSSSTSELARYKTELCRPFEETGQCRYGAKCQFAHGMHELRSLNRHPKYKTELCRTFHTTGFCSYGQRCNFIHNDEERRGSVSGSSQSSGAQPTPAPRVLPFDYPLSINSTGDSPASSIDGGSPSLSPCYLNDDVFSCTRLSPTPSFSSEHGSTGSSGSSQQLSPPGSPKQQSAFGTFEQQLFPALDLGLDFSLLSLHVQQ